MTDQGSADFILDADPLRHAGFIKQLILCAFAHQQKKKYLVRYRNKGKQFGLYAITDIKKVWSSRNVM